MGRFIIDVQMKQGFIGKTIFAEGKKEAVAITFKKLQFQGFSCFGGEIALPVILPKEKGVIG